MICQMHMGLHGGSGKFERWHDHTRDVVMPEHKPLLRCSRQCRMNPPLESFINEREALFMIRPTSIARGQYEAAAQPYPMPKLGDWQPEQYTLRSRDDGPSSLQLSQQLQPSSNGCAPSAALPVSTSHLVILRGHVRSTP